jgi:hypothetical protein
MGVTDQKRSTRRKIRTSAAYFTTNLSHGRPQNGTRASTVRRRQLTAEPWHGHFELQ